MRQFHGIYDPAKQVVANFDCGTAVDYPDKTTWTKTSKFAKGHEEGFAVFESYYLSIDIFASICRGKLTKGTYSGMGAITLDNQADYAGYFSPYFNGIQLFNLGSIQHYRIRQKLKSYKNWKMNSACYLCFISSRMTSNCPAIVASIVQLSDSIFAPPCSTEVSCLMTILLSPLSPEIKSLDLSITVS